MVSARRIIENTVKKYLIDKKLAIPLIMGVFVLLASRGDITITGYSGDSYCAGTIKDPCEAYINFTANLDVFLYVKDAEWQAFYTTPEVKEIKIYRSWGSGWREIKLEEGCTGSWCGAYWARANNPAEYSIVFRAGSSYQIKFVALKHNPKDDIKWGFTEDVDPTWFGRSEYNYYVRNIASEEPFFLTANKNSIDIDYDSRSLQIDGTYLVNTTNISQPVGTKYFGFSFNSSLSDGEMWIEKPRGGYLHLTKADFSRVNSKCIGDKCYEDVYYTTFASVPENKELNYRIKFIFGERPKTFMMYFGTGSTGIELVDGAEESINTTKIDILIGNSTRGGTGYLGRINFAGNESTHYVYERLFSHLDSAGQTLRTAGACSWVEKGNVRTRTDCNEGGDINRYFVPNNLQMFYFETLHPSRNYSMLWSKALISGSYNSDTASVLYGDGTFDGAAISISAGAGQFDPTEGWFGVNISSDWIAITFNINDSYRSPDFSNEAMYYGPDVPDSYLLYLGYRAVGGVSYLLQDVLFKANVYISNSTDGIIGDEWRELSNSSFYPDNNTFTFFNTATIEDKSYTANMIKFNGSHTETAVDFTIVHSGKSYSKLNSIDTFQSHNMSLGTVSEIYIINHTGIGDLNNSDIWHHYKKSATAGGRGIKWVYGESDSIYSVGTNISQGGNETQFCNATNYCGDIMSSAWLEEFYFVTQFNRSQSYRVYYGNKNISIASNVTLLFNGTTELTVEQGSVVNISCEVNVTGGNCIIMANNSVLGLDFANNSFMWNYSKAGIMQMNEAANYTRNFTFSVSGNQTINFTFHAYDILDSFTVNLTGYSLGGNFPTNITFLINGTEIGSIPTARKGTLDLFSDGTTIKNFTFPSASSQTMYMYMMKDSVATSASMNFSGFNNTCDEGMLRIIPNQTNVVNSANFNPSYPASKTYDGDKGSFGQLSSGGFKDAYVYENWTAPLSMQLIESANFTTKTERYGGTGDTNVTIFVDFLNSTNDWVRMYSKSSATTEKTEITQINISLFNVSGNISTRLYMYQAAGSGQELRYFEGWVDWYNRTCNSTGVWVDIGEDGSREWNFTGEFAYNGTQDKAINLETSINNYLSTCIADNNNFCTIPITLHSNSSSIIQVNNVSVIFTAPDVKLQLSVDSINSYLANSSGYVTLPINVSSETSGVVEVKHINITYGGSNVFNFTGRYVGTGSYNSTSTQSNLTIIFSNFTVAKPYRWTDYLIWRSSDFNQTQLNPYKQTSSVPIYNITWNNYKRNASLSVKINRTVDCMNYTFSVNNTYSDSVNLTESFQTIFTNSTLDTTNDTVWIWGGLYNCSSSTAYFIRNIQFKRCCDICVC